jgi:hypothetical protein
MLAGQPGENAKQGRFARPVRPAELEHFPPGKAEIQAFEQDAKPSRSREVFNLKDQ